jgi:aspartate racemase
VTDGEQYLWELPILTQKERHQLLIEWNDTATDYPRDKCIHQLFEAQVERTPEAVALVFGTGRLTYRELNTKANQLAHYLRKLGVGPEVLVGICLERSLDLIVALLGILKAGGAYVPLDPAYPQERIEFMLSDAQVAVLLTQEKLLAELPKSEAHQVCLDKDGNAIADQKSENPINHCEPANLVYILYTSGSTGRPKGVAIEHHSPVALVDWAQTVFTPEQLTGVLASTSICFDLSVFEIFVPLSCGGKVILAENALHLPTLPAAGEVTLINTVPTAIAELLKMGIPKQVNTVNLAGEPLSNQLAQQLYQQNIQYVFNLYGPSEDTTYSTYALVEIGTSKSPAIGKPIANTQIYILDRHLQQVPIGSSGEIYISGAGLARGYLNRPDLTAEKFIPNPVAEKFHTTNRVYKTGDLGRYLPDGNIEYIGRIDNQVKIRGFRIEIGEIEAVLAGHLDVSQVAVAVQLDASGNKCLAAYVVPGPGKILAAATLRSFMQKRLPDYMIPAGFAFLDALPLNPNGKVDRRALATQKWQSTSMAPDETIAVAPRDKLELQVAKIWEQVLGINSVGIRDNLFEVGGHSLLAARLLAEIEKLFGKKLPLSAIFQSPTVEQLANILREPEWSSPSPSMVVIQPGTGSYKPPLFCIHVLGRGLEFYRPLLNYLDRSQSVLGLSTQIMDEKLAPPNRVEELAAYYIKEMQTFQPHGPYFLLGVSFGGTVAFEMARQLDAKGQKVALLGLLDTYGPDAFKNLPEIKSGQRAMKVLQLTPGVFIKKAKSNLMGKIEMLTHIQWRILCKFYRSIGRPLPIYLENFTHRELNEEALRHYVAGVYSGRATIFKAVESAIFFGADRELGWGEVVRGEIEIHEIHSDHLGMLKEPHVRVLGEKLQAAVDRAQG